MPLRIQSPSRRLPVACQGRCRDAPQRSDIEAQQRNWRNGLAIGGKNSRAMSRSVCSRNTVGRDSHHPLPCLGFCPRRINHRRGPPGRSLNPGGEGRSRCCSAPVQIGRWTGRRGGMVGDGVVGSETRQVTGQPRSGCWRAGRCMRQQVVAHHVFRRILADFSPR